MNEASLTDTICETQHNEAKKVTDMGEEAKRMAILIASEPDSYKGKLVDICITDILEGRPG